MTQITPNQITEEDNQINTSNSRGFMFFYFLF